LVTLLDVIGLASEDRQRFILSVPAEARDGAVIAAAVLVAGNAELALDTQVGVLEGEDGGVRNHLDQAGAKDGSRNSEDHVTVGNLWGEVSLLDGAPAGIRAPGDDEQVMHATIRCAACLPSTQG
jgi:hypothetical protein